MEQKPEEYISPTDVPGQKQVVKKIEAVPIDEFFYGPSDPEDYPEEWDEDYVDKADSYAAEHASGIPIWWTPFDGKEVLKGLRKFSPEEEKLSRKEKRAIVRERLLEFKRQLSLQKEGIGRAIQKLRDAVQSNPDASSDDLLSHIKDTLAPAYGFTSNQLSLFKFALVEYAKKHRAVEKYRAMYPDDADLFEVCFGSRPVGKVEVVKGPMTLFFRCFELDDYAFVHSFSKYEGDRSKMKSSDKEAANTSGGCAFGGARIGGLKGTLTAENATSHWTNELKKDFRVITEVDDQMLPLFIDNQKDIISISADGIGTWSIQIVEKDAGGFPVRLKLIDDKNPDAPLFDVTRHREKDQGFLDMWVEDASFQGRRTESVKAVLVSEPNAQIVVEIRYNFITLFAPHLSRNCTIEHVEDRWVTVPDEEASNHTRIHEDQHQFDKLFSPLEIRQWMMDIFVNVAGSTDDYHKVKDRLIHALVRMYRRSGFCGTGMDSMARGELLAQYKEGYTIDNIRLHMFSPLYDYTKKKLVKEEIVSLPLEIAEDLKKYMSEVWYEVGDNDKPNPENFVTARAFEVDPEEIIPYIDLVFGEEYTRDLNRWIDSLSVLEQKGYGRDEIVSLLTQEPVNGWQNLARRMPPKHQ